MQIPHNLNFNLQVVSMCIPILASFMYVTVQVETIPKESSFSIMNISRLSVLYWKYTTEIPSFLTNIFHPSLL